ncbi:hypothetical protein [Streptomyces sp. NPDC093111]|uniref:hypothetical protein n=1 Tax=Streptomyces sp. NPDC093111 TaxID=3154978 RepID=UPI0034183F53
MDIPDWFAWIALGLLVLQVLSLTPTLRGLRGPDPAAVAKARLDLVDTLGGMLILAGLVLMLQVAESWLWLALAGFALMTVAMTGKGVRLLRARRRPTG